MSAFALCRKPESVAGVNVGEVLKPPGGGSSDIFGTSGVVEQSPRRVHTNHHLQSTVFGTNGTTEPPMARRNKPGNDSYNRLFGPVESRPQSTPVNRMKSNIPFGVTEGGSDPQQSSNSTAAKTGAIENGQQEMLSTPAARRNPVTGVGVSSSDSIIRRRIKKRGGNPVTGGGYVATAANHEKESSSPPAAPTNNGTGSAEIRRNRVPPGGYSSGLW
ncbi:hypothetical protein Cfor_12079 [Coptotermes formosanus]|uniref:Microtubule-associated protein Jupiter n=1 Tax=Coptotermes formosanus TaxID=36987 RepID=A0A6L2PQH7_COPFO|nr:hypothetical protein Cfor_12079 [Coptotermes formosanus]